MGSGESDFNIDTTDKKKMIINIEQNVSNFTERKILKPRFHVNIKHFGYRKNKEGRENKANKLSNRQCNFHIYIFVHYQIYKILTMKTILS